MPKDITFLVRRNKSYEASMSSDA